MLLFYDPRLEAHLQRRLAQSRKLVVARFGLFRVAVLLLLPLRAWIEGELTSNVLLYLVGALLSLFPMLAVSPRLPAQLFRPLQLGAVLTDVAQAHIGCLNHHRTSPSHPDMSRLASIVYLFYGSTALWTLCYTAFSFLPFHLELLKATLVCAVVLSHSEGLCASSHGLRMGYSRLQSAWQGASSCAQRAWRALLPSGAAPSAAVAALLEPPSDFLRADGSLGEPQGAPELDEKPQVDSVRQLCLQYQTMVVLLTFVASSWLVFRSQRRLRHTFLLRCARCSHRQGQAAQQQQRPAITPEAGARRPAAGCPTLCPADLAAAVAAELKAPPSTDADFLACMAAPLMLCVLLMI